MRSPLMNLVASFCKKIKKLPKCGNWQKCNYVIAISLHRTMKTLERQTKVKTHSSPQTILREKTIPGLPRVGMGIKNPPRMALPRLTGVLPPPHPLTSGDTILREKTLCETRYCENLLWGKYFLHMLDVTRSNTKFKAMSLTGTKPAGPRSGRGGVRCICCDSGPL
jgi:hypothetical protein